MQYTLINPIELNWVHILSCNFKLKVAIALILSPDVAAMLRQTIIVSNLFIISFH